MSEVISEQDAAARKEQDVATIREQRLREGREEDSKEWQYLGLFGNGQVAAEYLNIPPVQVAGEAMTTVRDNDTVAMFVYM
jgi:hypothetical protein